jgi:nucleotide-binding universal stress UspA family protein
MKSESYRSLYFLPCPEPVHVRSRRRSGHQGPLPKDVAQTIIEIAQENNVDIIVIGKRGVGRIAGLLLGSVSQKIVSLAPWLVTVFPLSRKERPA